MEPLVVSLASAICLTQVATFSTTIYLHRCATHRALTLHPAIAWLFRFALWVTTGLSTKEWVAVHRKHHAFTDEEGDPHSPRLKGFWPVQLGNVFYYVRETRNPETIEKYAHDIKVDRWDRLLFNHGLRRTGCRHRRALRPHRRRLGTARCRPARRDLRLFPYPRPSTVSAMLAAIGPSTIRPPTFDGWRSSRVARGSTTITTASPAVPSSACDRVKSIRAGRSFSC